VDPGLNLKDINRIREVCERCTQIKVHERHPYGGDLVFTAFSGSHQDAINKGMRALSDSGSPLWEVPYLPIDPRDIGRTYEAIIRINSQSGKGGVAYIMQTEFGCDLPKDMHPEFSSVVQKITERSGTEVPPSVIWQAFSEEYLDRSKPYKFLNFRSQPSLTNPDMVECTLAVEIDGKATELVGHGNGPIDGCKEALMSAGCPPFSLKNFVQHARSAGSDAEAVAYIQVEGTGRGAAPVRRYGVGIHSNIEKASILALLSAVNRIIG
jgi:2-isopropylmalate synthase